MTQTNHAIRLKEDFYRQIQSSPESKGASKATLSHLTEEELTSLATVWAELILWQQAQS